MSATRRHHVDLELDMEDTGPAPLARRVADKHRFLRFDPTVSSGSLMQLVTLLIGFAIAYGTYQSDRTQTKNDIKAIEVATERDRADAKAGSTRISEDMKEMKADIKEMGSKLTTIQAQTSITRGTK
ncbi:MAG: hypothetical protein V4750_18530 [Pseudomonadota bacterium]